MARHRREESSFRLLFVCTGNICRSPFAEIVTRHLLIDRLGGSGARMFSLRSAGTQAVVGSAMHPDMRAAMSPLGLEGAPSEGFAARQLRSSMVESSDLVLGAGPGHRSAVMQQVPAALSITFGIREFARLAAAVEPATLTGTSISRAHALVEWARELRGLLPPVAPEADCVPDPMGGPPEAHRNAAELIRSAVQSIVDRVVPPDRDSSAPS